MATASPAVTVVMTFALALLVLLQPGDEPLAGPLSAAVRQTLSADAETEVRVVAGPLDDEAALAAASGAQAETVAIVVWLDSSRRKARVRLHGPTIQGWLQREVTFKPGDAPAEKGRALGFTLASMLPEAAAVIGGSQPATAAQPMATAQPAKPPAEQPAEQQLEQPAKQPAKQPAAQQPTERPAEPESAVPAAPESAPELAATLAAPAPTPAEPPAPWSFSIDAAMQYVVAVGNEGSALGGEVGGQYRLGDQLALRAGAALRMGHIEGLEGTSLAVDLGAGLVWRSADAEPGRRWALALRLDGFARLQSVARPASGSHPAEQRSRFVPGVDVIVEARYALTRDVALVADAGGQILLGETDVVVGDTRVASFAPVGLLFGLGAQTRF